MAVCYFNARYDEKYDCQYEVNVIISRYNTKNI